MRKRVFVGINASKDLQDKIVNWRKDYWQKLAVRWLHKRSFHLTIIPPWYEENIDPIIKKLSSLEGKLSPFVINFNKVSYGPTKSHPRLIWIKGKSKKIVLLKRMIEKSLNIKGEKRPFKSHVTIARFKPADFNKIYPKELDENLKWKEIVTTFSLIRSTLTLSGAKYETIKKFELRK